MDQRSIPVLILCGGRGTRLRPLVADKPKALAEVAGKGVIFRILDQLAESGTTRCVLCTGYMGEKIRSAVSSEYRGMRIDYSHESQPLGTGGATRKAVDELGLEDCFVLNGDTLFDRPITAFRQWCESTKPDAGILLARVENAQDYGLIRLGLDGRVLAFGEKPEEPQPGLVNAGGYYFKKAVLSAFPADREVSLEKDVLPCLADGCLRGFVFQGSFLDIGTPSRFHDANTRFRKEG